MTRDLSRRGFLAGLGLAAGGLAIGVRGGRAFLIADARAAPGDAALAPNPFVHVAPDGTVTIVCHRSEMGQGVRSTLPALIGEELGADPSRIRVVQAVGDRRYGDQNTDGSTTMRRGHYEELRTAGATARVLLVAAAARRLRVREATLVARDHAVHHAASKRSIGFGALVADAARLPVPPPGKVTLRPVAELTRLAGDLPLLDAPAHVDGSAVFAADVRLPGMLTAVIARPPVLGGTVATLDDRAARAVPGVRDVLRLPAPSGPPRFQPLGGVAVLADHTWAALRGRAALAITWDHGAHAGWNAAADRAALAAAVAAPGKVVRAVGELDRALAGADRVVRADYHVPYLAHAPMEPPAAVARVDGGRCEVWACTQNPQSGRAEVARALGLDERDVTVHVTLLGGGFGRKSKPDFLAEAALLARAAGAPVRVQWTRDDDLRHGYYHSSCAQHLAAGLDARGKVVGWLHRTAFPSIATTFAPGVTHGGDGELAQGILDLALDVPAVRCEVGAATAHARIGWLRSVHNINHGFAIGSFIDELAAATGRDPRELWLELVGPPRLVTPADAGVASNPNYGESLDRHPVDAGRLRDVIERVTARADWSAARARGRALGLAAHRSFVAYVGVVVSVVHDRSRRGPPVRADEVWITIDAGRVVNRDRVRSQMEGAVIFGLGLALHGEITARDGQIEQASFRDYPLLRLPEAPRAIHVEIVDSDRPPAGVGEPGVPPVAPALCNAVFALTGTRVRALPLARASLPAAPMAMPAPT